MILGLGHTLGMSCGARWDVDHQVRLTLGLAERVLQDLVSCPDWVGFCADHPNALREFEVIAGALRALSACELSSVRLERASEVLGWAATLRVRCDDARGSRTPSGTRL